MLDDNPALSWWRRFVWRINELPEPPPRRFTSFELVSSRMLTPAIRYRDAYEREQLYSRQRSEVEDP